MVVHERLRGCGIGTRILEWVLGHALGLGKKDLFLFTANAGEFYRRFGFEEAQLRDFPKRMRSSAQYRAIRRFGDEWGVVAMKRLSR
jgi:N-acetylglutamate synthase-like GNAT family acetyltransferase